MRVSYDPRLPLPPGNATQYQRDFNFQANQILKEIAEQLNALSQGYVYATTNALTTAPTTGIFDQGDYIKNSTPSEAGTSGSKYVILGWVCVTAGEPGTWKECRALTGN